MKIKDILNRLDVIAEDNASDIASIQKAIADLEAQAASNPAMKASSQNAITMLKGQLATLQQQPPAQAAQAAPAAATAPKQNAGTAAGYKGSAAAQALAKANGITDVNKIQVGKTITVNGQPYKIKAGDTLDKIAAANKGSGAAPAAGKPADSVDAGQKAAVDASNAANAAAVAKQKENEANAAPAAAPAPEAPAAEAPAPAEGNGASPGAAQAMANMGSQPTGSTTPAAPADDLARMTQLAGAGKPAGGYGNFTGDQSAQPAPEEPAAAAPAAAPNPDTVAPVVKTGTGGTLTTRDGKPVTSRSNDEIAWAQSHPYQPYPGPGWQEKQKAQGQKNLDALKGVGNKIANFFGGNKQPAAPAPQQGQSTQPEPAAPAGGYGKFNESELSIIKQLSGLK